MFKTNKLLAAGMAAATLVAGASVATDASAQGRYRGYNNNNGAAVAAGIAGLALGAAMAGNGGFYAPAYGYGGWGGYGYAPGIVGYGYAPPIGYGGYYAPPVYARGYAYAPRRFYDRPYYGGYGRGDFRGRGGRGRGGWR